MIANPHVVFGTCFLVGMCFDPDVDRVDEESSAGIELTSKRMQVGGQEMLQATVIYSHLYSFALVLGDDIHTRVAYDTNTGEEKANINVHGLTDFFELKHIIIRDKNVIAVLKQFAKRKQLLTRLNKQHIDPEAFYGTGTSSAASSSVFESFSRQELAFRHFDSLLPARGPEMTPLKLFTFESLVTGKRQFLVADIESFMARYLSLQGPKRHVYEIIREDFPCRLYFDLEYAISANPNINGKKPNINMWFTLIHNYHCV